MWYGCVTNILFFLSLIRFFFVTLAQNYMYHADNTG